MIVLLLLIELIVFRLFRKTRKAKNKQIIHFIFHQIPFEQYIRIQGFLEQDDNYSDYSDHSDHGENSSVSYASFGSHNNSELASDLESFVSSDWGYDSSERSNYSSENE